LPGVETLDDLVGQLAAEGITATRTVLPAMREARAGTMLHTTERVFRV
jgi:hypothetical protein